MLQSFRWCRQLDLSKWLECYTRLAVETWHWARTGPRFLRILLKEIQIENWGPLAREHPLRVALGLLWAYRPSLRS